MKRVCLLFILLATFGAVPAFAQENPQQPATPDSTALDSSVQILQNSAVETVFVQPQNPPSSNATESSWAVRDYIALAAFALSLFAFLFGYYQYKRRIALEKEKTTAQEQAKHAFKKQIESEEQERLLKETEAKKLAELNAQELYEQAKEQEQSHTAEESYRKFLQKELGKIKLVGPGMDDISVRLDDTFVQLRILGEFRSNEYSDDSSPARTGSDSHGFAPDELIYEAFNEQDRDLLLIIGDPGSGKSTLMQYFAMRFLSAGDAPKFGIGKTALPVFLPLREVEIEKSLAENLQEWCGKHHLAIAANKFDTWLQKRPTLILLDGLDEVREAKMRQEICRWIDGICTGLGNARVVVTSRPTGYRGRDKVVLKSDLLQAEIKDFTAKQREEFLQKWFTAAYLRETHLRSDNESLREWQRGQRREADKKRDTLLKFLAHSKNKSLRELSGIPMLLQIMAILWKKDNHLPKNRSKLYEVALDYLLEYRDAQRGIDSLLPTDQAQLVLAPVCLWMQEEWQREEVEKEKLHRQMHDRLLNMRGAPTAKAFCENLRDRAGILADNTAGEYIFRHKSFREFFAGLELAKSYNKNGRLQTLAEGFFDEWWEEPLRFFISRSDGEAFDAFMAALFETPQSADLDTKLWGRLDRLVEDAREPQITALSKVLQNPDNTSRKHLVIIECLQKIGTDQALQTIKDALDKGIENNEVSERARQVIRSVKEEILAIPDESQTALASTGQKFFHNPLEYNAEYILIKGGTFTFQKGTKLEAQKTVPDLYFARYPVTNRQYRRFIRYLRGEESELLERVPLAQYGDSVLSLDEIEPDHREYLGDDAKGWADKLVSGYDDDRKFNGDDQPVVDVSWYAAQTYCLWLSILTQKTATASETAPVYRLPNEIEWEWAAAGDREKENGALRTYPWGETGPNDKLANYDGNVGATTPVGRYPDGATPEGLQDMAGNVWEWCANTWADNDQARVVRGGSFSYSSVFLRCAYRGRFNPDFRNHFSGFRVVASQVSGL
ncbi:MAG: SUMF1/EgtB/PvdO family nonheme iron enzyme [Deferribacteres bacterium]|nr:SUMF1/EgtB/PvdO family nonheme iron enzyme [Deferribacteres bacterium]